MKRYLNFTIALPILIRKIYISKSKKSNGSVTKVRDSQSNTFERFDSSSNLFNFDLLYRATFDFTISL